MSQNIVYTDASGYNELLQENELSIVDFYSDDCPPCEMLAPIFEKLAVLHGDRIQFIKIKREENKEFAKGIGVTGSPTVLFYKNGKEVAPRLGGFLTKPQVRKTLEEAYGSQLPPTEMKEVNCDVLILGAGTAGLSAALYAGRAKLNTVIVDELPPGGQTASTLHVENYPGVAGKTKGKDLIAAMRQQAETFGAVIDDLKEIDEVNLKDKTVRTEDTVYHAKAIILATGARPRALPAENADEFKSKGVHYCATCDGSMYQNRKIVVVGGGNSAVEEAVFLSKYASDITVIHQFDNFQASKTAQQALMDDPKIHVIWDSEVRKVNGQGHALTSVEIENLKTKERSVIDTEGAFVYIGTQPMTDMYKDQLETNQWGYVVAGEDTKTSVDGVFAAGDVRTKQIRQVVTAAADGAVAAILAERYVANLH